jgi:hypothetical protein
MERRRPRRTAEEWEAARLDMFRCLVLTAFFLGLLALLSLVLNCCSTPQTHQTAAPAASPLLYLARLGVAALAKRHRPLSGAVPLKTQTLKNGNSMQTPEQLAALRHLCQENGLSTADLWQHKQSGNWIMSKAGAEKVQGLHNIDIDLEVCGAGIDFAIVKVTATRTVQEGKATAKKLTTRTLGSANPKNCSGMSYYAEMAEKRATVRAVPKLMGFSKLGVYGEEEADDFARSRNSGGPSLEEATPTAPPVQPVTPGKPEAVVLGRVLLPPEVPAGTGPEVVAYQLSQADNLEEPAPVYAAPTSRATEAKLKQLLLLIASPDLDKEERDVLLSMPVDQRPAAWIENTLAKLPAVLAERQDPKTALEAARKQLRTVAARFQKEMPEAAYQALLRRAQALTAKPEQLCAEARQVLAQFQSVAA